MSRLVLLVEDNTSDEKLTLHALKSCGVPHQVVVLRDGAAALEYLGLEAPEGTGPRQPAPALILLDLKIPKVDGLEVLRRVRADPRTRLIPVVALTASNQPEDVLRGFSLGLNAYVRKQVDFAEFAEATRIIALFWLRLNEPIPAGDLT